MQPTEIIELTDVWTDEIDLQETEGGAPDELDILIDSPTEENAPAGSSSEAKTFRVTFNAPSWSRTNLTDETLGTVWAWLTDQAKTYQFNKRVQAALVFVDTLMHFGFPPEQLLVARLDAEAEIDETVLRFTGNSVHVTPIRSGGESAFAAARDEENQSHYLPAGESFTLPLPARISDKLNLLRDDVVDEGKFFYELFGEKSRSGAKKLVNRILKPFEVLIGEKVTAEKIARSVRAILREQGNLTDLEIALVSGEIPQRTASQMFYTNYEVKTLQSRYLAGIKELIKAVVQAGHPYVEHLNLEKAEYVWSKNYPPQSFVADDFSHVGSPFVPNIEEFSNYLNGLKREAEKTSDFILRYNRHAAYAALAIMTLAGLRPLELSYLTADHLNLNSLRPSIAVTAKINRKHTEWRTVSITPELAEILRAYKRAADEMRYNPKLLTEYSRADIDNKIGDAFFFFMRRTFSPVKLSTRILGEVLRENSYLDYLPFPWKLNAPRHLYRTTATKLEIPEKIINSLMGHQTTGAESLGLFSADNRADEYPYAAHISAEISQLLDLNYD